MKRIQIVLIASLFTAAATWSGNSIAQDNSEHSDSLEIAQGWVIEASQLLNQRMIQEADSLLVLARSFAGRTDDFMTRFMAFTQSGHHYRISGEPLRAREYYEHVLTFSPEEEIDILAATYNNISFTYSDIYKYTEAIEYQHKSLEYRYKSTSDTRLFGLFASYANIGRTYQVLYRYEDAIGAYEKALEYGRENTTEGHKFQIYAAVGELLTSIGNYEGSLSYLHTAEELATEHLHATQKLIIALSLGQVYHYLRNYDSASVYYDRALDLVSNLNNRTHINRTYDRLIRFRIDAGMLDDVPDLLESWAAELEEYPDIRAFAHMQNSSGYFYYLTGQNASAEIAYSEAIEALNSIPLLQIQPELHWRRAVNMAFLDREKGFELAAKAIDYTDAYRLRLTITGEARAQYFRELNRYFGKLTALYLDEGRIEDAFLIAESGAYRAFAEDLMMSSLLEDVLGKSDFKDEFDSLKSQIIALENDLMSLSDPQDRQVKTNLLEELKLRSESTIHEALEGTDLVQLHNSYGLSVSDVRQSLEPGEVALQMSTYPGGVSAILITKNNLLTWSVDRSYQELTQKIESLINILNPEQPLETVNSALHEMGNLLFSSPARQLIADKEKLIISTDGVLSYMPFEALRLWDDAYLVEKVAVIQTPSFKVRNLLQERSQRTEPRDLRALAVANPIFGNPSSQVSSADNTARNNVYRPLPFTQLEGNWVKEYFPGEVNLLTGSSASERYFVEENLNHYSVLHFATHGILEEDTPRFSRILLSSPGEEETDIDGQLSISEIYQLDLNADVVVLSACNSGLGRLVDGEGILGFQRAFIQAGSNAVIVTLWSVEDRSTAMLMRSFYRNLAQNTPSGNQRLPYTEALRQARLEMIGNRNFNHPYQWAAFILTGI